MSTDKLIAVVGPTASGKTALAVKIAAWLSLPRQRKLFGIEGAEIVSADSRQIYRGMDIGTAKPTKKEMRRVQHHLIDIKNPDEDYDVADFKFDAVKAINKIFDKKKVAILVGGTGLYVKAVVDNLDIPKVAANPVLRERLEKKMQTEGLGNLAEKLIELDPEAAYIIDLKNPRRVIRALEVAIQTGQPFTAQRKSGAPLFDVLKLGIKISKNKLRKKINLRAKKMIKLGLVREIKKLVARYGETTKAFEAIGYGEIIDYLKGRCDLATSLAKMESGTIKYAKRQMTWFKKDKKIKWVKSEREAVAAVKKFLTGTRSAPRIINGIKKPPCFGGSD